jgi:hypothetical protein
MCGYSVIGLQDEKDGLDGWKVGTKEVFMHSNCLVLREMEPIQQLESITQKCTGRRNGLSPPFPFSPRLL